MLLDKDDVDKLFDKKVDCFGTGATLVATSVMGGMLASQVLSSALGPKGGPQAPPQQSGFNQATMQQAKKANDTSSTNAIKAAKLKSGPTQQSNLLAGPGGVGDDELNTGTNLLA